MKKSKFDKIVEDIIKAAQDILDNTNDLIQDKKVLEANFYQINEASSSAMQVITFMNCLKQEVNKTDSDFEQVYNFTKKIEFDDEGDD